MSRAQLLELYHEARRIGPRRFAQAVRDTGPAITEACRGIGFVAWRIEELKPDEWLYASGGISAPFRIAEDLYLLSRRDSWLAPSGNLWRRWPSLRELLPTVTAPRGGIRFITPPITGENFT